MKRKPDFKVGQKIDDYLLEKPLGAGQDGEVWRVTKRTLGRVFAAKFLGSIDQEVKKIVDRCYEEAKRVLMERREGLELLSTTLIEKEVMDDEEVKAILKLEKRNNKKSRREKKSTNNASGQQS